ncbi:caskin-1 isoform X3 [Halichoeres trimaculatus]|uniref:caskin-1 isoform X3 n=1 Tax=Halichoeres trimaculatus TaxID=147232 RepID=UPI003D9ED227
MGKDQELLQAVKTEDLLTVQKLLQRPRPGKAKLLGSAKKVNVNFQDTDGFSPLHHASLNGNLELITLLLESQAAVDIRDQKGMRPLHYAAWQGKAEPMKMLLKSGSSVNGQSDEGQIPLHLAAQHGHYDVSEMLLQHQSNPCIVDNAGKTPLDLACEFGRVGVVQLLLSSNMCAALLEPKKGDTHDPNGTSPLHLAAKNGHIDIIRLLIQAGIDINRQTKAGTALHEAALCGKTEAVRLLLDSGINAAVRNTYSQTALDIVYQFTATQASREIKQLLRGTMDGWMDEDASAALQVRALKDYCNNYDLTSLNIKAGDVITVLEQHPDGRWKGCIHDNRTGNDRVGYFPSTMVEVISKRTGLASTVICTQQFQKIPLVPPATVAPANAVVNGNDTTFHQIHILPPPPPPPPHSHQPLLPLFTSFGYNKSPVTTPQGDTPTAPGCRGSEASPHSSPSPSSGPHGGSNEEIWVLRKPVAGGDRSSVGSSGSVTSVRSSGSGQSAGSAAHILHAQAEGVKLLATVLSQSAKAKEHLMEQSKSVDQPPAGSASSSRTSSQSGCPLHEAPPYDATATRKGEGPGEGKSSEAVVQWLSDFQLQVYAPNFLGAGYDLPTISRMTPEDLTAIGITKPGHRKKMTSEINKLSVNEWLPDQKPASLGEWLSAIGLSQYHQVLVQNGYENIEFITDITWEDLQEIGITKLGHQKKLMLAVKRLAEMQRGSDGRGSLRKKPPPITQQQEVMSMDGPPPEEITSPKMATFQDSELSKELQTAMTQPGQEVCKAQRSRTLSKDHDEVMTGGGGGAGPPPKKEARTMRQQSSQSSTSSHRGSVSSQGKHRHSHSHSQPAPPYTPPHTPTKTRTSSSSSSSSVQSTASPQAKHKPSTKYIQGERPQSPHSHPPQSPTHRGAPCPQPQPQQPQPQQPPAQLQQQAPPQHHPQMQVGEVGENQQPQVPLLCLPPEAELAEEEGEEPSALQKKRAHSLNRYAVSDGECDERPAGGGEGADVVGGQGSAVIRGDGVKYATVTHRVSRSHSVRNQANTVHRNHTQSFALRQKKKGPPPPPPKRSSSAISSSNSNLTDANTQQNTHTTTGGMLDVPYNQQRRASDLGVSVETGLVETSSMGSVRSIAAMLEMSSIGGGAKGMALQKNFLQVGKTRDAIGLDGEIVNRRRTISGPVSELVAAARRDQPTPTVLPSPITQPEPSSVMVNSSSPNPPSSPHPSSGGSGSSSENLPFADEGSLTIRRQGRGEAEGQGDGEGPQGDGEPQEDISRVEPSTTLKRRPRSSTPHPAGSDFTLQESSTVKRRPKSRDKEPEGFADMAATNGEPVGNGQTNTTQPVPYQNDTGTVKRRPVSDAGVTEQPQPQPQPQPQHQPQPQPQVTAAPRRNSADQGAPEGAPVRKPKPPVSPKPIMAQIKRQGGPQTPPQAVSNKRVPLPGPGTPGSPVEGKKIPPPVSPKPTPPPMAPKPAKLIHSMTSPPSPSPAPTPAPSSIKHSMVARQTSSPPNFPPSNIPSPPNAKSPSSQSPHTPQTPNTPTTPQTPQTPATPSPTPPPVKPPRSSIGGVSVDNSTVVTVPAPVTPDFGVDSLVHQKLEETSASLAAALQAVEDKILRQEDSVAEQKTTVSILDDIGSMFDDLADQLDAMLE